jgi:quercetin dioxygenase-like cupin family protein
MLPMTLHDWNSIQAEQLNPRMTRKCVHTTGMTVARIELLKDAVVPEHKHVQEQLTTVERGALKFLIDGREQVVRAGESLAIPAWVPHGVEALEDSVVMDIFVPAREDWIRGDDAYLRR